MRESTLTLRDFALWDVYNILNTMRGKNYYIAQHTQVWINTVALSIQF